MGVVSEDVLVVLTATQEVTNEHDMTVFELFSSFELRFLEQHGVFVAWADFERRVAVLFEVLIARGWFAVSRPLMSCSLVTSWVAV